MAPRAGRPRVRPAADRTAPKVLRLYVAGDAPNSVAAQENIRAILKATGHNGVRLAIVDVLREPAQTLRDGVLLTPTLVRLRPGPVRQIVGNLNDHAVVRRALGIPGGGE